MVEPKKETLSISLTNSHLKYHKRKPYQPQNKKGINSHHLQTRKSLDFIVL